MTASRTERREEVGARGAFRKTWFLPVMATDFLFWTTSTGLAPLLSRMVSASLPLERSQTFISQLVLVFAGGTICGRFLAGRWRGQPKVPLIAAVALSGLAFPFYFQDRPTIWILGQGLQGLALGVYGVSVVTLISARLPPARQMRGFAQIGMADFLGVASGPVVSGLVFARWGGEAALATFLGLMVLGLLTVCLIPAAEQKEPLEERLERRPPKGTYLRFFPLMLALWISILFHIYYSRYLPLLFQRGSIPVESLFFFGYVAGGILFRLGLVQWLERQADHHAFGLALLLMSLTSLLVTILPHADLGFAYWVVLTGTCYGLGFEMLYIFCLSWTAARSRAGYRGRVFAFVFFGFDAGNLCAGLSFGLLANRFSAHGLLKILLWLIPIYLCLPLLVKRNNPAPMESSAADSKE